MFVQSGVLNEAQRDVLENDRVFVRDYDDIVQVLEKLPKCTLLMDPEKVSDELYYCLPEHVTKKEATDPSVLMKAVKNQQEIKQVRSAHLRDGDGNDQIYVLAEARSGNSTCNGDGGCGSSGNA